MKTIILHDGLGTSIKEDKVLRMILNTSRLTLYISSEAQNINVRIKANLVKVKSDQNS